MESEEPLTDLMELIDIEKRQFVFTGLYPLRKHEFSWLHHFKGLIVVLISHILVISMIMSLIIGVADLSEITDIMYYLLTQTAYLIKLFLYLGKRSKLIIIEDHFKKEINYKYLEKYGRKQLKNAMFGTMLIGRCFRLSVLSVIIFYGLYPYIDDRPLPLGGWYPVNIERFRIPLLCLQLFCVFTSAFTNSSLDIFTAYLISIGVAQIKMLKKCLNNVDYAGKPAQGMSIDVKNLGDMVYMHKHIIKYVTIIEDIFSNGIFVQFLASMCVICLTGFQMLVVPVVSAQFVLLFSYFMAMMCQVALYCWCGNEILFESNSIGNACYMSNWYEGTFKDKKVLFFMMERSKFEIKLTAGKFFTLSLTTLLAILRTSYSYFAVLQRLYKDS